MTLPRNKVPVNLWLADDDEDDCMLFREALDELPVDSSLAIVNNGEELMSALNTPSTTLPDVLFLDLNMPRKTGLECLAEMKDDNHLRSLPVIIYSTSLDIDVVNKLYESGAHYYVRKPGDFSDLKKVIMEALTVTNSKNPERPLKENFIIQV